MHRKNLPRHSWLIWGLFLTWMLLHSPTAIAGAPIKSASEIEYPPFCVVDCEGVADGFSVELLQAALAAMGREVSFLSGTWSEVRDWLIRGEIQVLPLVGRTPEREEYFDFTFPYMSLHGAIVVREGTRGIGNLADLADKQVAVMAGDNAEEFLRRTDRGINIETTPTFEDALRQLSQGRHDAVVIQRLVALRLIQEGGLSNLRVLNRPIEEFRQDFCFAVREGDHQTLALLNEGLALVIADGTFQSLHAKWFAALELPAKRSIVLGGDHNFPPFEYLDEQGRPAGYNVDITRAIAKEMGLNVEIRLGPWKETRNALMNGEIDALQGMFFSARRNLTHDFSQPHITKDGVAVVRKGEDPPPTNISELIGKRIVVQNGDIMHDFALENGLAQQLTVVDSPEDALRELAMGKHDCALICRLSTHYWINKQGWDNLTVGRQPLFSSGYGYAVAKGNHAVLAKLSEGLKAIDGTGEYRRIHDQWMGVHEASPPGLAVIIRHLAIITTPLLALILLSLLWSWSLRKQVAKQTMALQESEQNLREAQKIARLGRWELDLKTNRLEWSDGIFELFEVSQENFGATYEAFLSFIHPDDRTMIDEIYRNSVENRNPYEIEHRLLMPDGRIKWVNEIGRTEYDEAGKPLRSIGTAQDITRRKQAEQEKKKLQKQLIQAQKMESVGRLAGGIAHDFNNMLTIIICNTEFALETIPRENQLYTDLKEIHQAAIRSATLTRQLLAFSRQQVITPKVINLEEKVSEMVKMLQRLIGEHLELSWKPGPVRWPVKMDPSQLDQIMVNLCINARDAIGDTGKITIATETVTVDEAYCHDYQGLVPGDYVLLSVSDNGSGIAPENLERIFDPFFTSKKLGQGTGLGLATVYGIVKQNQGFISVHSEPEHGTTFRIYLPPYRDKADPVNRKKDVKASTGQGETVLVVEDEAALLKLTVKMLTQLGYTALSAESPTKAHTLATTHADSIQLLLTDVVMPEMNGRELAEQLQHTYPHLKVLFMSGYTADVVGHHGVLEPEVHVLQKPFSLETLAGKVRAALDA